MPSLISHKATSRFCGLNIGPPGSGKTGALVEVIKNRASLGIERIIISDFNDGLDILVRELKPEDQACVYYSILKDKVKPSEFGSIFIATAFKKAMNLMSNWTDGDVKLGPATSWGLETLYVCDDLSGLGDSAMVFQRDLEKASISNTDWQYTAGAMRLQEKFVQLCVSLNCHVLINAHIKYMGGGGTKNITDAKGSNYKVEVHSQTEGTGYPSALGQQLPPMIGRHFNIVLETKTNGKNRILRTKPEMNVPLKAPLPRDFPEELPQETGLFRVMQAIIGGK